MANAGKNVCAGENQNAAGLMGDSGKIDNVDKSIYTDFWLRSASNTGVKEEIKYLKYLGIPTRYYSNTGKEIYYIHRYDGDGGEDVSSEKGDGEFWVATGKLDKENPTRTIEIPNGNTVLMKVDGNLEITRNIIYSGSAESISSAGDIPQVIIYATGNISIRHNVERIDAILIAGNTILTSNGLSRLKGPNDEQLSYPLTVRGVMIANKLYLERTYGAAAGYDYSQTRLAGEKGEYIISDGFTRTPAETINYDTSSILWARYMAGASESNTMTEVYRTELAPRY
jgi:hypothetical protein